MKKYPYTLKCTILAFFLGISFMGIFSHFTPAPITSRASDIREKRVVAVMVEREDTLWSIADKYYTEECGSIRDYIAEIRRCNSLENDTIYAGYSLIIPVWVSEEEAEQMRSAL